MSWFSDAFDFASSIVSGDSSSFVGPLIEGGLAIGGALIDADANRDAAKTISRGAETNAAAVRAANDSAVARFNEINASAAPARDVLTKLAVADPSVMTPAQQLAIEDANRNAGAVAAASGLRGAGRSTAALIRDADTRARAAFFDINAERSDSAASILAGQGAAATSSQAGLDRLTGVTAGQSALTSAGADASAGLANASTAGSTLGAIGSIFADEFKKKDRDRRFKNGSQVGGAVA